MTDTKWTTRVAPSPTGLFHLGTARTAYFCWLAAKASGGKFILRIDDTDVDRNRVEYMDVIVEALEWLGLIPDDTHYQSKRLHMYQMYIGGMIENGGAERQADGSVNLIVPKNMPTSWTDSISGEIPINNNVMNQIAHTVLIRSDGMPTYHFASIIDDLMMDVNWIIRGHDHISNTARQIAIWNAVWTGVSKDPVPVTYPHHENNPKPLPRFSHVGLLHTPENKKLSKRHSAASLLSYRDAGYHPDVILSYILRLGWSPKIDDKSTKIISRERAIEMFLAEGAMRSAAAKMDDRKLHNLQANKEKELKIPPDQWVHKRTT